MSESPEPRNERAEATAPADRAAAMLTETITRMGFEATVQPEEKGGEVWLVITSPDARRLIGREGHTLESLQLLLRRMAVRGVPGGPRFNLDVGDYRRGHLRQLKLTARDAADVVKNTGRAVTLEPMPAPERKVIHQALRGVEGIETVSQAPDRDGLKSIVVQAVREAAEEEASPETPSETQPETPSEQE